MRNKKIAFSGFMAALLFGAGANAAEIASRQYVDSKNNAQDSALATTLQDYSTTTQVNTIVSDAIAGIDTSGKADKVSSATNGNLAGLDSTGNLTDAGVAPSALARTENVYNKTEVYTKTEVNDKIADIIAGEVSGLGALASKDTVSTGDIDNISVTKEKLEPEVQELLGLANTAVQPGALDAKENISNKTSDITADTGSTAKYTSVKAVEDYVGTSISGKADSTDVYTKTESDTKFMDSAKTTTAINSAITGKEDVSNKTSDITADSGSTTKYTSVKAVEDYVGTSISGKADSTDVYTKTESDTKFMDSAKTATAINSAITGKEDTSNKTSDITADTGSTTKYTTVKAVEDAIDAAVLDVNAEIADMATKTWVGHQGYATNSALMDKEDVANKSNDIATDTGSTTKYTTVNAVENYVGNAVAGKVDSSEVYTKTESDTKFMDSAKTATAINSAITGKEDVSNKSDDITADAGSTTKYTTVNAVESHVDERLGYYSTTREMMSELLSKEDVANKSNDIATDTGSTTKYTSVKAVEDAIDSAVSGKANAATTLSGYGITDAMTTTQVNDALALKANEAELGMLAKAAPGDCADADKSCVLTFDGATYAWEVIER